MPYGCNPGCAATTERVEHQIILVARGKYNAIQKTFRLLGGMLSVFLFHLLRRADVPQAQHLFPFFWIADLTHFIIVKCVFRILAFFCPEYGLRGVGEIPATQVWRRVHLEPGYIVYNLVA